MQLAAYLEMTPPAELYLAMSRPLYVGRGGGRSMSGLGGQENYRHDDRGQSGTACQNAEGMLVVTKE
jgi:hypothetical protein